MNQSELIILGHSRSEGRGVARRQSIRASQGTLTTLSAANFIGIGVSRSLFLFGGTQDVGMLPKVKNNDTAS